jgi:hypothetical protein
MVIFDRYGFFAPSPDLEFYFRKIGQHFEISGRVVLCIRLTGYASSPREATRFELETIWRSFLASATQTIGPSRINPV